MTYLRRVKPIKATAKSIKTIPVRTYSLGARLSEKSIQVLDDAKQVAIWRYNRREK